MASFHLMRSIRHLPAFVKQGQLSFARSCIPAELFRPALILSDAKYNTMTSSVKDGFKRNLPQISSMPMIANQSRLASTVGDHVRLWQLERTIAASFIGLLPACIILENAIVDGLFGILLVMHSHWGLEALILDYARPAVVGTLLPKVLNFLLNLISAATLAGLLVLVYNGPGIGKSIKSAWAIGKEEK
ncbi:succinate dehydrogenase [ubiquinone] cytochrome b small subunit, mitochondrial isoform X2 [Cephus cinctus]|uniref:Succinate dehydrogenase [ubiquinone] cytochrome b small subunit n=1 Tax=Cephus cinctus TaxID=211228 RepID=A0AAJ7CFW2_CEPCN|nr:succinate dehydrogenase [ubiquinone] cytochrome b small subunit, mitochondrial isoform X2 [Cephus cinctus]